MTIQMNLAFEPTRIGFERARSELDRTAAKLWGEGDADDAGAAVGESKKKEGLPVLESPAVTVYRNAGNTSRSRRLLELLPAGESNALSPSEIGELLPPATDGGPLTPHSVRAVMRNVKRNEHTRRERGEMPQDREIIQVDWSNYESEGCGRYYLSLEDRNAIDEYRRDTFDERAG